MTTAWIGPSVDIASEYPDIIGPCETKKAGRAPIGCPVATHAPEQAAIARHAKAAAADGRRRKRTRNERPPDKNAVPAKLPFISGRTATEHVTTATQAEMRPLGCKPCWLSAGA